MGDSTKTYEVRIFYEGVSIYFVDADSDEQAAERGRGRYVNGEPEDVTGSEYEEIVRVAVEPVSGPATGQCSSRATSLEVAVNVDETDAAFKILTDKLLDAAGRFTSQGGSDTIRAYCAVLLDLDWHGERGVSIRGGLHNVMFYAASGAVEETRNRVQQIGNMVNGREWYDGNGRSG
jgi:hypothetical protein